MLLTKFGRAAKGLQKTRKAFDELSRHTKAVWQRKWEAEEIEALRKGGEHMVIYEVSTAAGKFQTTHKVMIRF
jgi:uncharacterized damage-inducible protein DinB